MGGQYKLIAVFLFSLLFFLSCSSNKTVTVETFTIGAIQPLTKDSTAVGEQVREGIEMAVIDINRKGGINGKPFRVILEDDQCDAKLAVSAFDKLTAIDGVNIIIGPSCSSNVLAVAPLANEKNIIILSTVASTNKITGAGDLIFRNNPTGRDYSYKIAEFAYNQLRAGTASLLYLNLDNGVDYKDSFKEKFSALGGKITGEHAYEKSQTDFRSELTKIKAENPDVIFLAGQINHGLAVKQARELGITTQFIGPKTIESEEFLKHAGRAAEGVIYAADVLDKADPLFKRFEQNYAIRFNKTLSFRTPLAYDAVMILAELLKKCGNEVNCVKKGLYKTNGYRGISGITSFNEYGDVIKPLTIKTVRDGEFVEMSK